MAAQEEERGIVDFSGMFCLRTGVRVNVDDVDALPLGLCMEVVVGVALSIVAFWVESGVTADDAWWGALPSLSEVSVLPMNGADSSGGEGESLVLNCVVVSTRAILKAYLQLLKGETQGSRDRVGGRESRDISPCLAGTAAAAFDRVNVGGAAYEW